MKYLKIFVAILILTPITAVAQISDNPVTCKFGKYTYESTENANFEITVPELQKDAHLYIYSKDKKYTITEYTVGVLSNGSRDMIGEFKKSDDDILKALKSAGHTVATGDRIFITDLQATCDGCTKPITVKPMIIVVK